MAGAGAGVALGCGRPTPSVEGIPRGFLKRFIQGPTINVHAHLYSAEWWSLPPLEGGQRSPVSRSEHFERAAIAREEAISRMDEATRARYADYESRREAGTTLEDDARLFLGQCDEAGIDTIVNLTTDNLPVAAPDGRRYGAAFETVLEANARLRETFPGRVITFAGVDPRRGAEAVRLLEVAVKDYGCAGYGEMIGTLWQTMPNDRDLVYPLLEKAAEFDIPWINDATMPFGFSDPEIFEDIAGDFPTLRLGLGGTGAGVRPVVGADGQEKTAAEAMLELAESCDNVWLDLDDWQGIGFTRGIGVRTDDCVRIFLRFLRRALDGPARERVMYGSDYPVYIDLYTEKDWIEHFTTVAEADGMAFTPEDWELFFSRNAQRFLGLA
jgi:predicted TIM-barrel fold metal-dependent hydrolase